jgi:hypothetical protein
MPISFSPRTGVSGILQDGVEVVTIGSTGITAGVPAATTAEIQALTITNKFVNPANAGAVALGVGQTWQTVTRVAGTTYFNTTGKPITFNIKALTSSNNVLATASVSFNGDPSVSFASAGGGAVAQCSFAGNIIIPLGASYVFTFSNITGITSSELQ